MRKNTQNAGFTLVELLIVVAIIGILAAVLTPQFLNARKVAVDNAVKAYASNLYTAVQAHVADIGEIASNEIKCEDWNDFEGTPYTVPFPHSISFDACIIGNGGSALKLVWKGGTKQYEGGIDFP